MKGLGPRCLSLCAVILSAHLDAQDWRKVSSGRPWGDSVTVWDPVRERVVLFDSSRITWEWDGVRWWQRASGSPAPPERTQLAWDPVSQRVLSFGGFVSIGGGFGTTNETWAYDGVAWTMLSPSQRPSSRYRHVMATDTRRGRVVMFGGQPYGYLGDNETWEWTGTDWMKMSPAGGVAPPPLDGASMAYDPLREQCVLFGGNQNWVAYYGFYSRETWEWDGQQWRMRSRRGPEGREAHGLAFDSRRGRVVLHGGVQVGYYAVPSVTRKDTWEWDGSAWQSLGNGPVATGSMVDAPKHGMTLLATATNGVTTWAYDGASWSRPEQTPAPLANPALAFDPVRQRAVHASADGTWEHDGAGWARVTIEVPIGLADPTLAHDASRPGSGEVLLFDRGATYLWNGATWTVSPAGGPTGKGAMVADTARGEVVLFTEAGETWLWRNNAWTRRWVAGPSPRMGAAMAFDPAGGLVFLFGGRTASNTALDDTWVWDGSLWGEVPTGTAPGPRYDHGMTWDSVAGQVVVSGGYWTPGFTNGSAAQGTWAFDGNSWTQRTTSVEPLFQVAMTELQPGRTVALSLEPVGAGAAWEYDTRIGAEVAQSGTGCGAQLAPDLGAIGLPSLGRQEFALDVGRMRPAASAAILLAAGAANLPLGNCAIYIDPATTVSVPIGTGPTGAASLPLPIPASIPAGARLFGQAAGLDPRAPSGIALSQRLTLVFGQ